jgi:hypothetical protein
LLKKSSTTSSKFEKMSASSDSGLNARNLSIIVAIIGVDPSPLPSAISPSQSTSAAAVRCIRSASSSLPAFRDGREGDDAAAAALVGTNAVAVPTATAVANRMRNIVDEDERIIVQQAIEGSTANAHALSLLRFEQKEFWMHDV